MTIDLAEKSGEGEGRKILFYEMEILKGHVELDTDKVIMYGIAVVVRFEPFLQCSEVSHSPSICSTPLMNRSINVLFMCVNKRTEP